MDWYYHDPGQGRVGPLSAEELRNRYRDRRIQLDTLVWREGLREWQPLDRVGEELDLLSVKPDASRPPPLPPGPPPGSVGPTAYASTATPAYAAPGQLPPGYVVRPAPQKRGMSGCLIALIVAAVVAVPMIAILAAIALPAYQDYVVRSKVVQQVDVRAPSLESAVVGAMAAHDGRCPQTASDAGVSDATDVDFGRVDGRCAFQIRLNRINPRVDGRSVIFVAPASPDGAWDCTGGDLPAKYRTVRCRADEGPTP